MKRKAKRKLFLFVAVLLTTCILSLAVLNLLVLKPAKCVYYGRKEGVECKVFCCAPQYRTLKQALIYSTYYRGNYNGVILVKIDKSFGKIYDLSIYGPNFSIKSKYIPTGKWIKFGSYSLNSDTAGKTMAIAINFHYDKTEKSGYGTDFDYVTLKLNRQILLLPHFCKPGFVPIYP